nr:NADH dehydrogenase subunit 2 [Eriocampa ovata]
MMTKIYLMKKYKTSMLSTLKYLFYLTMIMSTFMAINSSSWLNAWLMMEINLMSFIPLMMNKSNSMKISNSMMIYFIIQTSASSILLMMILSMKSEMNLNKINILMNCLQMSLLMKMGASPFHWWTPKIMLNMNWMMIFMFLTWQKITPLFLILNTNMNSFIYISALMSNYIGAILGINQTSTKLIMIYSSINHMGWMLMIMMLNTMMMMMYFLIYMLMNLSICLMMNQYNWNFMNQLFKNFNQNLYIKSFMLSLFLSLGGLPPFLGFLPKLMVLFFMLKNKLIIESFMFITMAVISLSYYINPLMSMLMMLKFNLKMNYKINQLIKYNLSMILMNMLIMLIMIMYMMPYSN